MSNKVKFISRARKKKLLEQLSQVEEGTLEAKEIREQLGAHAPVDLAAEEAKKKAEVARKKLEEENRKAMEVVIKKAELERKRKAEASRKRRELAKRKKIAKEIKDKRET